jgi:hypothetical protein
VLGYQALIGGIILLASCFGKEILKGAVGLAALWTCTHIFAPWLMIVQFFTIAISGGIGYVIASGVDWMKNK